ncbi:MAG: hypothetical protein HYZ42_14985 [Bacteroidetes bacterium]|nr:hypothetical protein [Bacteroidota bacterium]
MKHIKLLFVFAIVIALNTNAQKVFVMGNQKMKFEAAANQAELMWAKDKKVYIICPTNPASGNKKGKRSIFIFDNKGKKEAVKSISIDNDAKKPHEIEKVLLINSKIFCLHSFYDKTEKKYSLFQTTLAETDGQPESLGREILTVESKNADPVEGIDVVFSNDSSKVMVLAYENASQGKNQKLNLHCLVINKDDFSFDRDITFNIDMNNKGIIRAKAAISNQGSVYVMGETRYKNKAGSYTQDVNIYSRDNSDNQQSIAFSKEDMKLISIFDLKLDRNENLVIAGLFSNKGNVDLTSGGFLYILDVAKNEYIVTSIFDNDDDLSGIIRKAQDPAYAKDMLRPAIFHLYIDQANNYFLFGQQYEDPKDYAAELKGEVYYQPDIRSEYSNIYVICANKKGEAIWHKGFVGQIMYSVWDFNRLNIIVQEDREIRLMSLSPDKVIKFSKCAAPTEPDHKIDARCMCYMGDGKIGVIGHSKTGSGGFYLDFFDLATIDVKGKVDSDKKKKK